MNRVQFQPGSSLTEFPAANGTEKAACAWAIRRARRSTGFVCARYEATHAGCFHCFGQIPWQCGACHAQSSLRAGTATWVFALDLLGNLKRSLDGTHHVFRFFKYAECYLGEAARRFNRRLRIKGLVPRVLVVASARSKPWPERITGAMPVYAPC